MQFNMHVYLMLTTINSNPLTHWPKYNPRAHQFVLLMMNDTIIQHSNMIYLVVRVEFFSTVSKKKKI